MQQLTRTVTEAPCLFGVSVLDIALKRSTSGNS